MSEYKYLDQFIEDSVINKDKVIIQNVKVEDKSVNIFIVERIGKDVVCVYTGYSIFLDKAIEARNRNYVYLDDSQMEAILGIIKIKKIS